MLWSNVARLISYVDGVDAIGDITKVASYKDVFVNKKSIRQNEFYQAMATGLKPELMLEIKSIDYEDEKKISFNDKEYTIIRTYDKNGEVTELICQGVLI